MRWIVLVRVGVLGCDGYDPAKRRRGFTSENTQPRPISFNVCRGDQRTVLSLIVASFCHYSVAQMVNKFSIYALSSRDRDRPPALLWQSSQRSTVGERDTSISPNCSLQRGIATTEV
jgi:hypothetical protein